MIIQWPKPLKGEEGHNPTSARSYPINKKSWGDDIFEMKRRGGSQPDLSQIVPHQQKELRGRHLLKIKS
jgi:hypothetical protein